MTENEIENDNELTQEAESPPDELTQLRRDAQELRDKNLRIVAEMQNQQRRAQREKDEALKYAESNFAKELLVVLDGLERALDSAAQADGNGPVVDGVRIVHEQFLKVLADHGIQPLDAAGQTFNPEWHEAVMMQDSADHAPGMVIQQLARGYQMHDRVIRTAKVIVSK